MANLSELSGLVRSALTPEQVGLIETILGAGDEAIAVVALVNIWMSDNYDRAFAYAWACGVEYGTPRGVH